MVKTATDKVYDALHEMIASKKLLPNQQLVESSIAQMLGVSRTPVREAIRRLEKEGLVDSYPNKGCFLKKNTFSEMADGYEIIAHLSSIGGRHLAQAKEALHPKDIDSLRAKLSRMEELDKQDQKREWVEQDIAFHQQLIDMTNCDQLITLYSQMALCVQQVLWLVTPLFVDIGESTADHRKLLDLILFGDPETASTFALKHHMKTVSIIRKLKELGIEG